MSMRGTNAWRAVLAPGAPGRFRAKSSGLQCRASVLCGDAVKGGDLPCCARLAWTGYPVYARDEVRCQPCPGALTGYAIWYAALPRLRATTAAGVQLSVPVLAALGGVALLAEPVTMRLALASLAVLGGISVVILGGSAKARS